MFEPTSSPAATAILPKDPSKRLGQLKLTYDGYQPLDCPDWLQYATKKDNTESPMKAVGRYLADIVLKNVSMVFSSFCFLAEEVQTLSSSSPSDVCV